MEKIIENSRKHNDEHKRICFTAPPPPTPLKRVRRLRNLLKGWGEGVMVWGLWERSHISKLIF